MKEPLTQKKSTKLRYIPGDLTPGAILAERSGEKVTEPTLITAALSLYFNWEKYRKAHVSLPGENSAKPCEVSYDEDEESPTELRLLLTDLTVLRQPSLGSLFLIQLEIFNVSYAFSVPVLAYDSEMKYGFHFVVGVPNEMVVQKRRPVPRVRIEPEYATKILNPKWRPLSSDVSQHLEISGMDLNTIYVDQDSIVPGDGTIDLDGKVFQGNLSYKGSRGAVIQLRFETSALSGEYFDIYKRFAFPSLAHRSKLQPERVFDVYRASGFFDKFLGSASAESVTQYREKLKATWASLKTGTHETVADYCSVDTEGKVIGASSLALAFKTPELDVWAIQQLCVRSEPNFFHNTRELYLWRPVYLMGRPDTFNVVCWFDSKSRWIERIWIKFANHKGNIENTLWPVTMRIFKPVARALSNIEIKTYQVGGNVRKYIAAQNLLAATDPNALNFANLLNHVAGIPPNIITAEDLKLNAEALAGASEQPESEYRLSVPHSNQDAEFSQLPIHNLDRLCYFEKQDLPFLYSSIEHSIAVMERKHLERG